MAQLHSHARRDFETFALWTPESGRELRPAGTFPFVEWPDGHWCLEVNLFLLDLLDQGCAHAPRGGTLGTYAAYLSPLVRYCFEANKKFIELTDGEFSKRIEALYSDTKIKHGVVTRRNNRTTVRAIASVWLDFLAFVGELCGDSLFVARGGRIRAHVEGTNRTRGGSRARDGGWQHHSLGSNDPYNYRMPLSDEQLKKLRSAASTISRSEFSRRRRLVVLELFDVVGLRRIEASRLTVGDVQRAIAKRDSLAEAHKPAEGSNSLPTPAMLSFWKAKARRRRGSAEAKAEAMEADDKTQRREVPVPAVTLQFFSEYLYRLRKLMKRLGMECKPKTPFFINLSKGRHRGQALMPNWFTLEFAFLAKAAGITSPCSPHMARHRYIVRELIRLIQEYKLETIDDFRRALLDTKSLISRLRQLTGHSSLEGIEPYIQIAFDELAGMESAVGRVHVRREVDALDAAQERYNLAIEGGEDPAAAGAELARAVDTYRRAIRQPD